MLPDVIGMFKGLLALATAVIVIGAIVLLVGMWTGGSTGTALTILCWVIWEALMVSDRKWPIFGEMISCWEGIELYQVERIIANLLLGCRLAFLLPLAYLHWW